MAHERKKILVIGAGGPMGAALASELSGDYALRLADKAPLSELKNRPPQLTGAPVPVSWSAPHEWIVLDVCDEAAVEKACKGMDAVVNLTVVRKDPEAAFHVNAGGVYSIMKAVVACGIKRVVLTGPYMIDPLRPDAKNLLNEEPWPDHDIYTMTKFLGQETARMFSFKYGIEVVVLQFARLCNPNIQNANGVVATVLHLAKSIVKKGLSLIRSKPEPFIVSWADAARAIRKTLEVDRLPQPFKIFYINANEHPIFSPMKAASILGWTPKDEIRD